MWGFLSNWTCTGFDESLANPAEINYENSIQCKANIIKIIPDLPVLASQMYFPSVSLKRNYFEMLDWVLGAVKVYKANKQFLQCN